MTFGMPFLLETATIEDCAALCHTLGLSFVELNLNFPPCQTTSLDLQQLHRIRRRYAIDFTLHLEEDCDPFAFNRNVRHAWLDSLRRTLVMAQAMEAPVINMHLPKGIYVTLPDRREYLYHRYQQEYMDAVRQLRDLCDEELSATGTRMAIENTDGFAPHEQAAVEELLRSPVFGLTLDIGHSHVTGDTDIPFYQAHSDRLIHMHGHDAKGKKNHLALGDGEIDLSARFAWAQQCGARVVLETKTVSALRTSVEKLHNYLHA